METSLHRQLKTLYAGRDGRCEVALAGYRIDVVRRKRLYEIQHGSLAAIRRKVALLLESHDVTVVKPIVIDKFIVHLDGPDAASGRRRLSPKHGRQIDLFDELIYFTRVFPHPRLTLEFPFVTMEETRRRGHGRRRRWRANDHIVVDQQLLAIGDSTRVRTAADLWRLLPQTLPTPFETTHLAAQLGVARWIAQRIAYCLLHTGAINQVGKRGNARLYQPVYGKAKRRRAA